MKFGKNDEAVSPVIGVILMVAITVILAAVIAAFVFGMGPPAKTPQAQLYASDGPSNVTTENGSLINIQHKGGDTIARSELKVIISNSSGTLITNSTWYGTTADTLSVGDSAYIVNTDTEVATVGTYTVQIVHIPTNSFLLDTKVQLQ